MHALLIACGIELGEEALTNLGRQLRLLPRNDACFEHQQVRNREENFRVAAVELLLELGVLLSCALYHLAEADQLISVDLGDKVCLTQTPCFLEPSDQMNQLRVVSKLRIDDFYVF